ncbi:hypothetical protein SAMN05428967_4436 [Phyllobacterium sp. YR620]|uniref:hypothetical protein n=1 Tax=Phyllobacterium sp. YR620 TaxID=1881066 RepID=UPI00089275E4|nr:hypothetical protein [Phyllobacterium sp. YR620]SDP92258.1 hypothetical protein SAMN05428967_4436 [Phyllobacterium sp. YR620]
MLTFTQGDILLAAVVGLLAYLFTHALGLSFLAALLAWIIVLVAWFAAAAIWRF